MVTMVTCMYGKCTCSNELVLVIIIMLTIVSLDTVLVINTIIVC